MAEKKTLITEGTALSTVLQGYALYQQFMVSGITESVIVQGFGILSVIAVFVSRQIQKRRAS